MNIELINEENSDYLHVRLTDKTSGYGFNALMTRLLEEKVDIEITLHPGAVLKGFDYGFNVPVESPFREREANTFVIPLAISKKLKITNWSSRGQLIKLDLDFVDMLQNDRHAIFEIKYEDILRISARATPVEGALPFLDISLTNFSEGDYTLDVRTLCSTFTKYILEAYEDRFEVPSDSKEIHQKAYVQSTTWGAFTAMRDIVKFLYYKGIRNNIENCPTYLKNDALKFLEFGGPVLVVLEPNSRLGYRMTKMSDVVDAVS